MRRSENRLVFGTIALFATIVAIGFVYAGFTGTLNINGTGNVTASKWDIYFANLSNAVTTGHANVIEPATIQSKTRIGDYLVEFDKLGDSLTYRFDVVNDGSFDAVLTVLTITPPQCSGGDATSNQAVCNNLEYTLRYTENNRSVAQNDKLLAGETKNMTLKLKVKYNGSLSGITRDVEIGGLGITMIYSQNSAFGGNPTLQGGDIAKFLPGQDFNVKIKQLANPSMSNIARNTFDSNIISIQRSNTLDITPTANNKISSSDSDIDIYAWFNNGTLYYYSTADKLYMNEDASHMFRTFNNMTNIDFTTIDTSKTTTMMAMFVDNLSMTTYDLSRFDTSNVTNMLGMFSFNDSVYNNGGSVSLTTLDLSSFNTSNVTTMQIMFQNCRSLTTINLSSFNTSKVTDMSYMFLNCISLTTLDTSLFDTSSVTNMYAMFSKCSSLTTIDLSSFDTSKVTNMSDMFFNCTSLTSLDLSNFNTSSVTNIARMFANCTSLTSLDLSNFNTSNVTNMSMMFAIPTKLFNDGMRSSLRSLNISSFDTSKVTNMLGMFYNCDKLTNLNLSHFNTSNVTDMSYLFQNTRFDDFDSIKNWNVSKVVNMDYMFGNNPNLVDLTPLRNWITTNLTTIGSIFRNDTGITSLNGLQNWNVSKVTNFSQGNDNNNSYSEGAFEGLSSLTDASAINGWDIKSDAHFEKMFKNTPVHPTFTKYAGTWGSDGTFTITQ